MGWVIDSKCLRLHAPRQRPFDGGHSLRQGRGRTGRPRSRGRGGSSAASSVSQERGRVSGHSQAAIRLTLIKGSNSWACTRSNASCMPSHTSGVEPNTFDRRQAIAMETAARTPRSLCNRHALGLQRSSLTSVPGCTDSFSSPTSSSLGGNPHNRHRPRAPCPTRKITGQLPETETK